jgi:hypothetical protein
MKLAFLSLLNKDLNQGINEFLSFIGDVAPIIFYLSEIASDTGR